MTTGPEDAVRDPFAGHTADRLAFLYTPPLMPSGSVPVDRGANRSFDAGRRVVANETAVAYGTAREAEVGARAGDPTPAPDSFDALHSFGVDLTTLTPDQLGQLMAACAEQMAAALARAAAVHLP